MANEEKMLDILARIEGSQEKIVIEIESIKFRLAAIESYLERSKSD